MTRQRNTFDEWWQTGVHGWDTKPHGAEHSLARQAYEAGVAEEHEEMFRKQIVIAGVNAERMLGRRGG